MTILTVAQTIQYAARAGFSGTSLQTIVAIAQCESGLDTTSVNQTTSGLGVDQGLVKINTYFHPEVPTSCSLDPLCSLQQAYRISKQGTDFHEWVTFTNGCYLNNMPDVFKALSATPGLSSSTPTDPLFSSIGLGSSTLSGGIFDWINNPMRLFKLLAGILMVLGAVLLLVSPDDATMKAGSELMKAVT